MLFNPEMKVRELTVAEPSSTRVLEACLIDYCCGGGDRCVKPAPRPASPSTASQSASRTLVSRPRTTRRWTGGPGAWRRSSTTSSPLEKDLFQHIHLENDVLFRRAIELESRLAPELDTPAPLADARVIDPSALGPRARVA